MEEKVCRLEKELEERKEKGEEDDEEGMGQVRIPTPLLFTFPIPILLPISPQPPSYESSSDLGIESGTEVEDSLSEK
jgi:hypothetical protein